MNVRTDSLQPAAVRSRAADYLELTKPRITVMVVITALIGFKMGATTMTGQVVTAGGVAHGIGLLLNAMLGIGLVAAGAAVLNQLMERDIDRRMQRTSTRPLPARRLSPEEALVFGTVLAIAGIVWLLVTVNPLTAALAAFTITSYLFAYTPLKRHTPLCTLIGAVPGAMPPLLGWAAARGSLEGGAWALFAIMFVWQLPHFLAIAWMYREDYARGGLPMLPVIDRDGHLTSRHIAVTSASLIPISLAPTLLGMTGMIYFAAAVLLGVSILWLGIKLARTRTTVDARRLFLASIIYLPVLMVFMIVDRVAL